MTPALLDDPMALKAGDPGGMLRLVTDLPDQCRVARAVSAVLDVPAAARDARTLVCAGMGGSAIAGDLLAGCLDDEHADRVRVLRGWGLPAWVDTGALLAVTSYSGNTPEALSAYDAGRRRGLNMIALSSGGVLAERARRDGVPWVELPGGFPPRAAVGHAFFPLFRVATRLGMVTDAEADEVPERLRMLAGEWGPGRATSTNPAKMLAVHLQDRLPVLHAATPITRAVARRFMAQLAENAKTLALVSDYPELTHNEVVAWDGDPAWTRRVSVVEFIDPEEAPGIAAVRSGVATLARQHGGTVMQIAARGTTRLERTWSFVLLVDLASVYLALLQGRDPSTIAPITWLKGLVATDAPGGRS